MQPMPTAQSWIARHGLKWRRLNGASLSSLGLKPMVKKSLRATSCIAG